ncbi:MAG: hypothetical protein WDN02_03060 [Methylovirgula sp.]|uniref:hypothetical protein n=1 Tax=Methylovirgula sp. TaxID=1978224 RepID=UPI003076681A
MNGSVVNIIAAGEEIRDVKQLRRQAGIRDRFHVHTQRDDLAMAITAVVIAAIIIVAWLAPPSLVGMG